MNLRRLITLAACFFAVGTPIASAQTVILRHAAPGSTLDVVIDTMPVGSGTAAENGNATVTASGNPDRTMDANVWLDACGIDHRVIVASRAVQPPPAGAGCKRTQIEGLFLVQRITTLVIDARGTPTLRIRQGRAPDEWLRDPPPVIERVVEPFPSVGGLTLFGGGGLGGTLDFRREACGNVTECSEKAPIPLSGGVAWWFSDFVAAEARFGHLGKARADGSAAGFRFNTSREGGVISLTGRAGVQAGRLRPFGRGGFNYHRATFTTVQTHEETTITVGGVEQIVPGGTQTLQYRTGGWAPVYGGGLEVWLTPVFGFYGDVQRIDLKGNDLAGTPLRLDDAVITAQVGLTFRIP